MFNDRQFLRRSTTGIAVQCQQARSIVQIFALLSLFTSANFIMPRWAAWRISEAIVPLWPIQWINALPTSNAVDLICLYTLAATALAFFLVEKRWARLNAAIALLFLHALINSFGKINHSWHGWILVSFAFIFLPTGPWRDLAKEEKKRQAFFAVIWGAQLLLLLIYSMSGGWKIYGIIQQWQAGAITALHPYAFAYQIANRTLQTDSYGPLSALLIAYPWLGWLPYLAILYFETFALVALWRPPLQKLWAAMLILFHIGAWLTMTIAFNAQIVLLGLLLWCSPFAPLQNSLQQVWRELPLVKSILALGQLGKRFYQRFSADTPADP